MRDIAVVDLRQAYFPDTPGVYAVFDEGDTLVYIGYAVPWSPLKTVFAPPPSLLSGCGFRFVIRNTKV
jgi:hypothetical protein